MGVYSPRVPELYSVGRYKRRWCQSFTDVDGAWDVPVIPGALNALRSALKLKHSFEKIIRDIKLSRKMRAKRDIRDET